MDIDRSKVASLGIALGDVNQTVGIYLGSLYVNSFNVFGRDWQVNIQAEGNYRHQASDINLLAVRNNQQEMVLMGTLANVREIGGPIFVNRYNLYAARPVPADCGRGSVRESSSTTSTPSCSSRSPCR